MTYIWKIKIHIKQNDESMIFFNISSDYRCIISDYYFILVTRIFSKNTRKIKMQIWNKHEWQVQKKKRCFLLFQIKGIKQNANILNSAKNVWLSYIDLRDFKLQIFFSVHPFDKYICTCNLSTIIVSFKLNNLLTNDKLFTAQPTYYGQ